MGRKLYALFILIGAIGFLVLVYLYFFVYYTATLEIQTNVEDYEVQLFSLGTATKVTQNCESHLCLISDVSPFEYNMRISKSGYESESLKVKIQPRKRQSFIFELQKQARLEVLEPIEQQSVQAKINKKRNQNKYYSYFEGHNNIKFFFKEVDEVSLEIIFSQDAQEYSLGKFPKVPEKDIHFSQMHPNSPIMLRLSSAYYIFLPEKRSLEKIPIEIPVSYIKNSQNNGAYFIVTEKGVFVYNIASNMLEYQYIFKDFVQDGEDLIGIIMSDESEKKENFSLEQSGNLIVRYNPTSKERKVLIASSQEIDAIFRDEENIIIQSGETKMYLRDYK